MDEAAFREGLRRRDRAAWDRCVLEYGPALERQARAILPSRLDPENALGDVWLNALRAAGRYDPARAPYPWLARICVTTCLSHRRALLTLFRYERRAAVPPSGQARGPVEEARAALRRVLQRLPRREREVLVLRFLFEVSVEELAVLLGVSGNAVRKTMLRGLERLRSWRTGDAMQTALSLLGEGVIR